jgi:hypothetical protein
MYQRYQNRAAERVRHMTGVITATRPGRQATKFGDQMPRLGN